MENSKVKNNKMIYAIIITAILVFAIAYSVFVYLPKYQEQAKVDNYKRELYQSLVCQYSCPLSQQLINNKTQEAPNQECIMQCTQTLKELQNSTDAISNAQLTSDNLIKDMGDIITACRTSSIKENNSTKLPELNNSLFLSCSADGLKTLEPKYSYLN